jgi:hypothetical protein
VFQCQKGKCFRFSIEGLGELTFIFTQNTKVPIPQGGKKYYVECFWNPGNYGSVDFIVGYYAESVDDEVKRLCADLDYYIDGARISCESHVINDINEEVYLDILRDYFKYDEDMVSELFKSILVV